MLKIILRATFNLSLYLSLSSIIFAETGKKGNCEPSNVEKINELFWNRRFFSNTKVDPPH